ncbi:MAG: fibrobacter succinogenes major paralogous domain-containing protein, partial [Candidatus Marinimicrobia bacterium]|nr:fibrobacter succinogenes major paralogous domain-containing protein [Candidatus Neomarinimicrobiota bacterium]
SCEYTDIDGNAFTSIVIGNQRWMVENLSVTHYRNGDAIPTGHSGGEWGGLGSGAYAIYDDDPNNADIYGNLYNWYAVHDSRNIAPSGWHVPSDEEWMELEMYLGMWLVEAEASGLRGTDEGGKLKAAGTIEAGDGLWYAPNEGATNESGFAALPGGGRTSNSGNYSGIGNSCVFWTSSDYYDIGWYRELDEDNSQVYRSWGLNRTGRSVRCVRNASY